MGTSSNPQKLPAVATIGGQAFTNACFSIPAPPTPDPIPPDGGGDGGGGSGDGGVPGAPGYDQWGVKKIFPDYPNPEFPAWYLTTESGKGTDRFNISYGTGSHISYTKKTEGNLTFINSAGAVQSYASGNPDSTSVRADTYPSGGIFASMGSYSYKINPGYLYKRNHFHNKEMTMYCRPHGQLKTHEAFAFKVQGRDNDDIRSAIEMVYPTASHGDVEVNVNYKHFPYVHWKNVRQYSSSSNKQTDNKWVGVKCILIVADNKKSVWMGMFEDVNPFTTAGKPANNWKLRADTVFTGVSDDDYDNIIPIWDPQKDTVRLDGFQNQDIMWYSNRPIDKAWLKDPQAISPTGQWHYGTTPSFNPSDFDESNI
jgi:hypothetical protein